MRARSGRAGVRVVHVGVLRCMCVSCMEGVWIRADVSVTHAPHACTAHNVGETETSTGHEEIDEGRPRNEVQIEQSNLQAEAGTKLER